MRTRPTPLFSIARGALGLFTGLLVLLLLGCGKKAEVPVPVKGKVINPKGKPLADAVVTFHPQEEMNKKEYPSGRLADDGSFDFTCIRGRYKVTVAPLPLGHGRGMPGAAAQVAPPLLDKQSAIPTSYRSATTTPLEITIPEGGADDLVLKLKG